MHLEKDILKINFFARSKLKFFFLYFAQEKVKKYHKNPIICLKHKENYCKEAKIHNFLVSV